MALTPPGLHWYCISDPGAETIENLKKCVAGRYVLDELKI